MSHEGYANPVMNDGPRFLSNVPVSELTEHVTRAIKASNVSSTPPVAETADGVTITKTSRPSTGPPLRSGTRENLDSQGDRMRCCRTMGQILGRGYVRKLRIMFLKQETLSPTSFAILSSIFSDTCPHNGRGLGLTRGQIRVYIYPYLKSSHA